MKLFLSRKWRCLMLLPLAAILPLHSGEWGTDSGREAVSRHFGGQPGEGDPACIDESFGEPAVVYDDERCLCDTGAFGASAQAGKTGAGGTAGCRADGHPDPEIGTLCRTADSERPADRKGADLFRFSRR